MPILEKRSSSDSSSEKCSSSEKLNLLAYINLTVLAYVICMVMWRSGVRIGMIRIIIQIVRLLTRRGQVQENAVSFAAAPGAAFRGSAALRIASGSGPTTGTTASAFVLSSWTFSSLPFALLPFAKGYRGEAPVR